MSIERSMPAPSANQPIATQAQVRDTITADVVLTHIARRDQLSGLRGLAKALGRRLENIPADPATLRPLLAYFPAAKAGLSTGRWRNIRSHVQRTLAHVGLLAITGRSSTKLSTEWSALLAGLPTYADRYKLSRFARYCVTAGVAPEAVNEGVLARFAEDLRTRSMAAEPGRLHREVILAWNRRVATDPACPCAPPPVPDNRDVYALPWDRFPPTLHDQRRGRQGRRPDPQPSPPDADRGGHRIAHHGADADQEPRLAPPRYPSAA